MRKSLLVLLSLLAAAAGAEPQTLEAYATYESEGEISRTGAGSATYVGTMTGLFFVRTPEGPSLPARIVCPGSFEIDLEEGSQKGEGKCTIEGRDGANVFADWTCAGYHLVGCRGDFTLTGGTGRFEGVTGGGGMTVRGDVQELATSESTVSRKSQGIVHWQELRYEVP